MPKHALVPTREKPCDDADSSHNSPPASVVLSNEVLLRSKIAQLESQRKKATGGATAKKSSSSSSSSSSTAGGKFTRKASGSGGSKNTSEAAGGRPGDGQGGARGVTAQPESADEVLRRFEAQVNVARKASTEENAPEGTLEGRTQWPSFTPDGMQALREMHREQVRAARMTNKHADVLTRKTQELGSSNEVMRAEAEACAREAVRLEQAAAKLHALSLELDGRHVAVLETRKAAAADETSRREEMNAALNTVVSDISIKIREQEDERIAQDKENSDLRVELQTLLQEYEDRKSSSSKALEEQEEETLVLKNRLEKLTAAAKASFETEEGLRKETDDILAREEVLRRRVGEHASRLKRQEEGLKTHQESIQRLEIEKVKLSASVARLSKEKSALVSRAGVAVGDDGDGASDAVADDPGEDGLRALVSEKGQRATELEAEKEHLQARCRELQAERKTVSGAVEALVTAKAEAAEHNSDGAARPAEVPTC